MTLGWLVAYSRASFLMSSAGMPVIFATFSGGKSAARCFSSSKPAVYFST